MKTWTTVTLQGGGGICTKVAYFTPFFKIVFVSLLVCRGAYNLDAMQTQSDQNKKHEIHSH